MGVMRYGPGTSLTFWTGDISDTANGPSSGVILESWQILPIDIVRRMRVIICN